MYMDLFLFIYLFLDRLVIHSSQRSAVALNRGQGVKSPSEKWPQSEH